MLGRGLEEERTKSWRSVPRGMPTGDAQHSTQLLEVPIFASFSLKCWGTYGLKAPRSPLPSQSKAAYLPKAGQRAVVPADEHMSLGSAPGAVTFGWPQTSRGRAGPCVRARGRTRMPRLQLSALIHVAISEALKYGVICVEKANATAFPITFC